jgi:hypothetical protein
MCRTLAIFAVGMAALSTAPAHADEVGDLLKVAAGKLTDSVVSIRDVSTLTVKEGGQTQDHDVTAEFHGVVVSPDGLIMCTNSYFSSDRMKEASGRDITVNPREIRVTVGNETTEYYGSLAAMDSVLGLAFVQIRDLKGRTLPYIDLTAAQNINDIPSVGDPTASVTRLSKRFDYAPMMIEDRVVSIVDKPRKAYVPEGFAGSLGLPVYGIDGNVIGVVTSLPAGDESQEDFESEGLSHLFEDVVSEDRTQFVLPTSVVAPLIGEAKTQAAALPAFVIPAPRPVTPAKPATTPGTAPGAPTPPAGPATPPAGAAGK